MSLLRAGSCLLSSFRAASHFLNSSAAFSETVKEEGAVVPVTQTNASQFKGQIKRSVSMDCSVWPLMNNSGVWRRQCKS